jgi:hypothetical protein
LFARSVIYDAKTLRGFWLFRWVVVTATLMEVHTLVTDGELDIPQGQSIAVEHFTDAVALAEASADGAKPLLVFPS